MNCIQEINYILEMMSIFFYCLYEILIFSGISIIYSFTAYEYRLQVHKDVTHTCNNYCKDIWFDIGWKMCEIITCGKIFHKKYIIPNFHYMTNDYFINSIILIKNGEEIKYYKNMELLKNATEDIDYDLIFYTDFSNNNTKKNYTIISENNINNPMENIKHKCDVNFIIFQLTMDKIKYDINLKEPKNFMIKNNTLKMPFFKWYIKKIYNVDLKEDYSVSYMTQDMNITNLQSPFFIKLNDEGMTSFSSGKPKIEKEKEEEKEETEDEKEETEDEKEEKEAETIKLCENTDCERYPPNWDFEEDTEETYQEDQWKKCCLCDGYFDDDGFGDILFVQEEPNNQEAGCNFCGKEKNIVQMKGSGQYLCEAACDESEDEDEDEDEDESENKDRDELLIKKNEQILQSIIKSIEIHERLKEHYD